MTRAMPTARRIELLLQTALTERHLRKPLLAEAVDELVGAGQYPEAAKAGIALLTDLDTGIEARDYERRVQQLLEILDQTHSSAPGLEAIA
jgi:hypothetical protein